MAQTHTPTPWKAIRAPHGVIDIFDANEHDITTLYGDRDEHKATAALICKAVNSHDALVKALETAGAVIGAIYQHLERVEAAGGAASISGVAACNTMLKSLRKNADRIETLVMEPLRAALTLARGA